MIDINDIAALLHVEEKLRAHGNKFPNMLKAVMDKLSQHEATHAPQPQPEPQPEVDLSKVDEGADKHDDDENRATETTDEPRRRL